MDSWNECRFNKYYFRIYLNINTNKNKYCFFI